MKLKAHRSLFRSFIYFQVLLKNELILDFQYFVQIYQALGGKLTHILSHGIVINKSLKTTVPHFVVIRLVLLI